MSVPDLPIEPALPALAAALRETGRAVLQAPPGAGKTTRVPLALVDESWLAGRKILLLEPRRLAARAAARRMSQMLGERPGQTVGYRIRRDSAVGPDTRIEVVTEGILTRMLQSDPALEAAGLVVFDEFHERSLHADLGLALALQSRSLLRPDLRLLVMSATLEGAPVAALLGGAPVITSEGRSFPVETRYLPRRSDVRLEPAVASAVRRALAQDGGDILVFLPGAGEIRRTAELLQEVQGSEFPVQRGPHLEPGTLHSELVSILPLHGSLSGEEQDRAILPSGPGQRKVVLATSIAETSLTIEGVQVVIDAGLSRVPKFSPRTGMTRLTTVRVSRSSADQRRGRAGRTAPGVCYRLWAAEEDHHLLPRSTPEILEADLAPLALELAATGVASPGELAWLDPPPAAALAEGRALLRQLGALDPADRITAHGRELAELGTHPRLGHLLLNGRATGVAHLAGQLAALLEERDILRSPDGPPDPDLQLRLDLLASDQTPPAYHGMTVDRGTLHRVRQESRAWERQLRAGPAAGAEPLSAAELLALAYPDRVAQRREGQAGRFLLRNGMGASTAAPVLALADYLVAAELDGDRRESRIWLAAALTLEELLSLFAHQIERREVVQWVEPEGVLKAVQQERLGAIVLREAPLRSPEPEQLVEAVLGLVRQEGLAILPWSDGPQALRERLAFVHRLALTAGVPGSWPDVSDAGLLATLSEWLGPRLRAVRRRADLTRIDLAEALIGLLGWEERRALDRLAPTHLEVPSGSRITVSYADPAAPVLAVRLQEVFGLTETPRVGGGRVPVTMQLLSPAHRPVQVTQDLAGFWRSSYFDVRKDLRGRYPKHHWPEDPLVAEPTRRAKPRRQ